MAPRSATHKRRDNTTKFRNHGHVRQAYVERLAAKQAAADHTFKEGLAEAGY